LFFLLLIPDLPAPEQKYDGKQQNRQVFKKIQGIGPEISFQNSQARPGQVEKKTQNQKFIGMKVGDGFPVGPEEKSNPHGNQKGNYFIFLKHGLTFPDTGH